MNTDRSARGVRCGATRKRGTTGRRVRQSALAVAVAVLGVAMVAACSSSDSKSGDPRSPATSGANPAAAGGSPAPAGDPITIGAIESTSGPLGNPLWGTIADVWEKWTNAHGGLNRHPVKVITRDNAGDPAKALSAAKELVEKDHVVAIAGSIASGGASIASYANDAKVPVVGGQVAGIGGPYLFPSQVDIVPSLAGATKIAKQSGASKFAALMPAGGPISPDQTRAVFSDAAKAGDLTLSYFASLSPAAPDYSAPCLALTASGAESTFVSVSPTVNQKVIQTCLQQGYRGSFIQNSVFFLYPNTDGGTAAKNYSNAKMYVEDAVWPWYDQSTQAQKDYFAAIAQYAPGMLTKTGYGPAVQEAWVGFQLFAEAAKLGQLGPKSTMADVVNALYQIHDDDLGGLTGPLTYNRGDQKHASNCYFVSQLQDRKWADAFGGAAQCVGAS